jgi:hypothetical protein
MNKEQFIYWLKGFAKAVNEKGPTWGQWEIIASELSKIEDCPNYGSPIEEFKPSPMWQEPHYVNPWDKYKITCQPGDTNLTTSSGSSGAIIVTPGYGSITYNPSTTTLWNPSGSNWSYTSTLPQQPTTGSNQLELDLK